MIKCLFAGQKSDFCLSAARLPGKKGQNNDKMPICRAEKRFLFVGSPFAGQKGAKQ